jgi:hypothetical protein
MRNTIKTRPAEAAARAANPPQLQRNVLNTGKSSTPGPVFFLVFAGETVEPSLTNPKSITYKMSPHSYTEPVHLYRCGASRN